ncbi:MAG: 2-dehydropantoate 2-reductase [Variovorax sp.]|nr:2-dehydropantoate 2-reductase [Variovorax sp.]
MKKICIYGLGAIGGLIGARLAASGHDVSAIARGETLEAVAKDGLVLSDAKGERRVAIRATGDPDSLGAQDLVILSVKTTALPAVAARIQPLIGENTTVLSAMNGIPWWFLHGLDRAPPSLCLSSVDPAGALSAAIPARRVLGCVTHLSAAVTAPGRVRHVAGNQLIIGEPAGGASSARATAVIGMLERAAFDVERASSIQQDIWFKLWGNMTMNPVSFLTSATGDRILDDDFVRGFMSRCMVEAGLIGERIGLPIRSDPEERHAVTRKLGAFKTSMLQDLEACKPVELDALVGVVTEMGRQLGVDTPNLEALFGLARLKARGLRLYPEAH